MATQTLHLASSVSGGAASPGNALGNTPATWAGVVNGNTSWSHEWAFTDPTEPELAAQQQSVAVVARKGSNSGNPSATVNVRQGGQVIATASATVTSTTGQSVTATWAPADGAPSQGVTVEVVVSAAGGSPNARNSVQVSMATWTAQVAVTGPPTGTASSLVSWSDEASGADPDAPTVVRTNHNPDPRMTSAAGKISLGGTFSLLTGQTGPAGTGITTARRCVASGGPGNSGWDLPGPSALAGEAATVSLWVRPSVPLSFTVNADIYTAMWEYTAGLWGQSVSCPAGQWTRLAVTGQMPAAASDLAIMHAFAMPTSAPPAGVTWDVTGGMIEVGTSAGSYFDGATPDTATETYAWTGTPHASASTMSLVGAEPDPDAPPTGSAASAHRWVDAATGSAARAGQAASTVLWATAATGSAPTVQPSQGSAAASLTWADAASGMTTRTGQVASTLRWADAGTGARTSTAAAASSLAWTDVATGGATRQGATVSQLAWATSATGSAPTVPDATGSAASSLAWLTLAQGYAPTVGVNQGTASTALDWATEATGTTARAGQVSSALDWADAATGSALRSGQATSLIAWADGAAGTATRAGTVTSTLAWTDVAAGSAPDVGGAYASAASTITWATQAAGAAPVIPDATGTASSTLAWTDQAQGITPVVGAHQGTAADTLRWADSASGATSRAGQAADTLTWRDSASGRVDKAGHVASQVAWADVATGSAPTVGAATGQAAASLHWAGTASGAITSSGGATSDLTWTDHAAGINGTARPVCHTGRWHVDTHTGRWHVLAHGGTHHWDRHDGRHTAHHVTGHPWTDTHTGKVTQCDWTTTPA